MDAILIMELPLDGHGDDNSLPDKVKLEDDAGKNHGDCYKMSLTEDA